MVVVESRRRKYAKIMPCTGMAADFRAIFPVVTMTAVDKGLLTPTHRGWYRILIHAGLIRRVITVTPVSQLTPKINGKLLLEKVLFGKHTYIFKNVTVGWAREMLRYVPLETSAPKFRVVRVSEWPRIKKTETSKPQKASQTSS